MVLNAPIDLALAKDFALRAIHKLSSVLDFTYAHLLIVEDRKHSQQEPRYHGLGKTDDAKPLHTTFALRFANTLIYVISARKMH